VAKLMERDTWFTAEEALEFGIIDEVLTKRITK
jgi:ATP-dependent protease ClpP protease subunit